MTIINLPFRRVSGGYVIDGGGVFDGAQYATWTPGGAGDNPDTVVIDLLFKRNSVATSTQTLFSAGTDGNNNITIQFTGNQLQINQMTGAVQDFQLLTNALFRDPSGYYSIQCVFKTGAATASDRVQIWQNGIRHTFFATANYPSIGQDTYFTKANEHSIGRHVNASNYVYANIARVAMLDNVSFTDPETDGFGETVASGWKINAVSGLAFGANGFLMEGASAIVEGTDSSGNGNDFTTTGHAPTATNDSPADSADYSNYPRFNRHQKSSSVTPSNGNRTANGSGSSWLGTAVDRAITLGDTAYIEFNCDTNTRIQLLLTDLTKENIVSSTTMETTNSNIDYAWRCTTADEIYYQGSSQSVTAAAVAVNDVIALGVTADGEVKFYKNNAVVHTFTQKLNAGVDYTPVISLNNATSPESCTIQAGPADLTYSAPAGTATLDTYNMPAPDVLDASLYYDTALFTGNSGVAFDVSGLQFQPDFILGKPRSLADNWRLTDAVQGAGQHLIANATSIAVANSQVVTAFNSDGFSVGTHNALNNGTNTYMAACLKMGGSGASNTDGSIASTVSVAAHGGTSIVKFTGTAANGTVGHGLSAAPKLIILKRISGGTSQWYVYCDQLTSADYYVTLNGSAAQSTSASTLWQSAAPTASTFYVGTDISADSWVAYCFADVSGLFKIGTCRPGTNQFTYLPFRPGLLLVRKFNTAGSWHLFNSKALGHNPDNNFLYPNGSDSEYTNDYVDLYSNGFRFLDNSIGLASDTCFYFAIADAGGAIQGSGTEGAQGRAR